MGSRIREDVTQLYLCFCEVARPETSEKEAWIIQKYPDTYKDDQVLGSVPKFVYPCEFENTNVQHFSFVLTNLDSKWTFGFCRHDPKTETALVFLSHLPWHEVFVKVLNCVAELIRCSKQEELDKFLYVLLHSKVPDPGASLTVNYNNDQSKLVCQSPLQFQLPKIPENRNLTEYYSAVEINNMLVIFASMLYERRIIFISRRLSRLSACVQAANAIIYPMHWQHIYIPVLPKHLIDYLLAPMPFLIGVPTPIWEDVKKSDLGDVVVLDADSNLLQTPFNDVESLPQDIVRFLKSQLKNRAALLDDGFARVFLKALVQLIGGYRDALKFHQGQRITFNEEAFIESRPSNMQPFLRDMLHLQIFQQFIEERLDLLNAGLGFSDEFEFEACNYSEKSSSKIKAQYREWVSTMRVQGSAFLKTVKNKANPAVKSAVKSVKEKGKDVKTAYKGIRSKMRRETNFRESSSVKPDRSQPRSAPSSPTSHRTRPMTFGNVEPVSVATTYKKQRRSAAPATRCVDQSMTTTGSSYGKSNEYVLLSPPSDDLISPIAEAESASKSDVLPRLDMDLMGDLQEVINRKCSLVDNTENTSSPPVYRSLKPVRSFDTFHQFGKEATGSPQSHAPLSSTTSLPLSSFSTSNNNPFSFAFPTPNPLISDPFGFTSNTATTNTKLLPDMNPFFPDVVQTSLKSNGLLTNNNLTLSTPATNPPVQAQIKGKRNGSGSVGDLIRLDSIPKEESFDPLENDDNDDNDECIAFPQGLTNPLYPYYKLNGAKETDSDKSNFAKPFRFSSNTSFLHSSSSLTNSQFNKQDLDLLKEYGIDFKTNGNNLTNGNKTTDPFEIAFDNNTISQKNSQSNWATFD